MSQISKPSVKTSKEGPGYVLKGCYISPKLDPPSEFYGRRSYYTHIYLKKGIELWNMNLIKKDVIPKFKLDEIELYDIYKKTPEEITDDIAESARRNHQLLLDISDYVFKSKFDLDVLNLLMAISVERVLKGLLLYNGYVIHQNKRKNRLTKISDLKGEYDSLDDQKVYTLGDFTKFHILESALPEVEKDDIKSLKFYIEHLKTLRDAEVHLASNYKIFQLCDVLLFKKIDNLISIAITVDKIAYQRLEQLRLIQKNDLGGNDDGSFQLHCGPGNYIKK